MSDFEAEPIDQDFTLDDDTAHQTCFVFKPLQTDDLNQEQPAKKRRKTTPIPDEEPSTFPLLNHGSEPATYAQIRHDVYHKVWREHRLRIDSLVDAVDEDALSQIVKFVNATPNTGTEADSKLRVGLIHSGPEGGAQSRLLEKWDKTQVEAGSSDNILVHLRASQCLNLQITFKNIIKATISSRLGGTGYTDFLNAHKKLIPMPFDLELLQVFVQEHNVQRVVISLLDAETVDMGILSDLLATLASYSTSIPFVCLLGIATTIELFESRLSKNTINVLSATLFTLRPSSDVINQILDDLQNNPDQIVRFSPSTISALEDLTKDQNMTLTTFISAIKYAIMSHFFANSLSVLLHQNHLEGDLIDSESPDPSLCPAIRNTDSFQEYCTALLDSSKHKNKQSSSSLVSSLLTSDQLLVETALTAVQHRQQTSDSSSIDTSSDHHWSLTESTHFTSRQFSQPFIPRPRFALERALSKPTDYLTSTTSSSSSSSSIPATSTLYNLLQEAGTTINVRDLFDAFAARVDSPSSFSSHGKDDADKEKEKDDDDRAKMCIFYTALAELKMLGLVKRNTGVAVKKRATGGVGVGVDGVGKAAGQGGKDIDFVAKTGWAGL